MLWIPLQNIVALMSYFESGSISVEKNVLSCLEKLYNILRETSILLRQNISSYSGKATMPYGHLIIFLIFCDWVCEYENAMCLMKLIYLELPIFTCTIAIRSQCTNIIRKKWDFQWDCLMYKSSCLTAGKKTLDHS